MKAPRYVSMPLHGMPRGRKRGPCNSGVGLKDDNCSHCTWHEDVWGWGVRSLMVVFKMFRFPRWNFTESWYISEV